jgi:hypothetical protein
MFLHPPRDVQLDAMFDKRFLNPLGAVRRATSLVKLARLDGVTTFHCRDETSNVSLAMESSTHGQVTDLVSRACARETQLSGSGRAKLMMLAASPGGVSALGRSC